MKDIYLYPATETLKNLFNEKDGDKLNEIEAAYTALRIKELVENPIKGDFDISHLLFSIIADGKLTIFTIC